MLSARWLSGLALCAVVFGCSSGSSGPSGGDEIDRSGLTVGTISAFSSVVVNGSRYTTDAAIIVVDDAVVSDTALEVGQVAKVTTEDTTNLAASRIEVLSMISGVLQAIDPVGQTLQVLSVPVRFDANTIFSPALDELEPGDSLVIYGFDGAGLTATRVERSDAAPASLTGRVATLDQPNQTLTIHGVTVDFSGAVLQDFAGLALAEGQRISVGGVQSGSDGLVADTVKLRSATLLEGTAVEAEGIVAQLMGDQFTLGSITFVVASTTSYAGGSAADLVNGARVEASGAVQSSGEVLVAEVEFEATAETTVLTALDDALDGTVTVVGAEFTVTLETQLIDDSDADVRNFSVADLAPGDWLDAAIRSDEITRLKRINPEDTSKVKGPVSAVDAVNGALFVAGMRVELNGDTSYPEAGSQTVEAFLDSLSLGDRVEVTGDNNRLGAIVAEEISVD